MGQENKGVGSGLAGKPVAVVVIVVVACIYWATSSETTGNPLGAQQSKGPGVEACADRHAIGTKVSIDAYIEIGPTPDAPGFSTYAKPSGCSILVDKQGRLVQTQRAIYGKEACGHATEQLKTRHGDPVEGTAGKILIWDLLDGVRGRITWPASLTENDGCIEAYAQASQLAAAASKPTKDSDKWGSYLSRMKASAATDLYANLMKAPWRSKGVPSEAKAGSAGLIPAHNSVIVDVGVISPRIIGLGYTTDTKQLNAVLLQAGAKECWSVHSAVEKAMSRYKPVVQTLALSSWALKVKDSETARRGINITFIESGDKTCKVIMVHDTDKVEF